MKKKKQRKKETQAIVHVPAQIAERREPVQIVSAKPTIQRAIQNMEQVRRFVVKCLNTDLQKRMAKLKPGEQLNKEERERLEIDWGTIPSVDKPFLKQPGAEKFLLWLNLRPKFHSREADLGNGHMEIVCKVVVHSKKTGEEVFEGPECSCTTMESNYRFRYQERPEDEPPPSKEEAEKLKAAGLGKFRKKPVWARGQKTGEKWVWLDRIENPNIHDERNKVRQIGEKRALVKCVRNMGGMSEIFISDPGEWVIGDEDFGSPFDDQDYTAGGRLIVTADGRTPSGSPMTEEARSRYYEEAYKKREEEQMAKIKAEQAKPKAVCYQCGEEGHHGKDCPKTFGAGRHPTSPIAEAQPSGHASPTAGAERSTAIADRSSAQPSAPEKPKGTIEWHWLGDKELAYLAGDGLGQLIPQIKQECFVQWMEKSKKNVIVISDFGKLKALCTKENYTFVEIQDKDKKLNPEEPEKQVEPIQEPQGPVLVEGHVETVNSGMTNKNLPTRQVKVSGKWYPCYSQAIQKFVDQAAGKDCGFLVDARKTIVGIRYIGKRKFDTDGRTPVIDISEDRQQTTASLFS